jgi:hypothetical protein
MKQHPLRRNSPDCSLDALLTGLGIDGFDGLADVLALLLEMFDSGNSGAQKLAHLLVEVDGRPHRCKFRRRAPHLD